MSIENLAITVTNDLPIKHEGNVHNGKVRSVYWLSSEDSENLASKGVGRPDTTKGVMVISDRISAYEEIWKSVGGLEGVPGKGAALNAISQHWFERFEEEGLAGNHVLATPHPLVWIVEQAQPIMVEAIARQYITGSMWRAYASGAREFCGIQIPDGLRQNQKLDSLLITPSTKGILKGIPGVPEKDDVNVTRAQLIENYQAFRFHGVEDIRVYETLLTAGFNLISDELDSKGIIFVDTKFEFGYVMNPSGILEMIYIDEVGTLDSSRNWNKRLYKQGTVRSDSKEKFREELLDNVPDRDVLTNKDRMPERDDLAKTYRVPDSVFMETSKLYLDIASKITGKEVKQIENARVEILDSLNAYGLVR